MKLHLLPALLLASSTLLATPAFAQGDPSECSVDADCPMSYSCQEIGAYTCAVSPPCMDADEEDCEVAPDCGSGVIMGCVAPPPEQCDPSANTSSCEDGLTCLTYTYEQCSGGADICVVDPSGETDCAGDEPRIEPSCTTESESYCVPAYFAPCQVDSDCGGGFACVDEPGNCSFECNVGAPISPCVDGDDECDERASEDCVETCEAPSGAKYCELIEVACSSDADCSGDLSCQDIGSVEPPYSGCDVIRPRDDDDMGGADMGADAGDCIDEPVVPTVHTYCLPDDWDRWGGGSAQGGEAYDDVVTDSTGRESDANGEKSDWKLVDKQPAAPLQRDQEDSEDSAASGCMTSQGGSPAGGLGLLAALGMMLGLRRKKKS